MSEKPLKTDDYQIRCQLLEVAQELSSKGLNINSSGNLSVRVLRDGNEGFLITPSGIDYASMTPSDLVFVEMEDVFSAYWGQLKPSSEWELHEKIYRERKDIDAVVHTHSCHATALSCLDEPIPAFHYMVAMAKSKEIACAKYATFGSTELAEETVKTLGSDALGCLLSHHGVIACGRNLQKASTLAQEIENLAHMWLLIRNTSASCKMIDSEEMDKILEKFKHYGQNGK